MSRSSRFAAFTFLVAIALMLTSRRAEARATSVASGGASELRVLFLGNSHTRYNNLPHLVKRLLQAAGNESASTEMVTIAGSNLRAHWSNHGLHQKIRSGRYTHVVLQGHSQAAIKRSDEARRYMRLFSDEARAAGSQVILYNTWARRGRTLRPAVLAGTQDRVNAFYAREGAGLNALVAPVGQAWIETRARDPRIELYKRDGIHPTLEGSYVAACVFYGVLTGHSPEGVDYVPFPVSPRTGETLQRAAADTLRTADLVH